MSIGLVQKLRDIASNPMMRRSIKEFGEEVRTGYEQGLGKSIFAPRDVDYTGMTPRQVFANEIGGVAGDVVGQGSRQQYWRYNHPLALMDTGLQSMGRAVGLGPTASRSLGAVAVAAPFILDNDRGRGVHFPERVWSEEEGKYILSDDRTVSRAPLREAVIGAIGWSGPLLPYEQYREEVPGVSEERYDEYKRKLNTKGGPASWWVEDNLGKLTAGAAGIGALVGGVGMARQVGKLDGVAEAAIAASKKVGLSQDEFFEATREAAKAEQAAKVAKSQIGRQAVYGAGLGALGAVGADTLLASGAIKIYDKPTGYGEEEKVLSFGGFETPLARTAALVGGTAAVAIAGPRISDRLRRAAGRAGAAQGVRGYTQAATPRSSAIPNQAGPPPGTPYPFDLPY